MFSFPYSKDNKELDTHGHARGTLPFGLFRLDWCFHPRRINEMYMVNAIF